MSYQQQTQQYGGVPSLPLSSVPMGGSLGYGYELQQHQPQQHAEQYELPPRPYSPGSLDVINAERVRSGLPPIRAQEDVRARDAYYPTERSLDGYAPSSSSPYNRSFGASAAASSSFGHGSAAAFSATAERERLKKFNTTRTSTLRPVIFQPNGSFRALKESGKLTVEPDEADAYKANRKIRHEDLKDTFVANQFGGRTQQIPGYTGFVPGVRATYAKRYGAATEQEMLSHATQFPRRDNQSAGFARTQLPREHYPVSSAPLPGGALSQNPPEMYIPEHVRYLKFFAQ